MARGTAVGEEETGEDVGGEEQVDEARGPYILPSPGETTNKLGICRGGGRLSEMSVTPVPTVSKRRAGG